MMSSLRCISFRVAGNINRERSPSASGRPRASSLEPGSLYQCSECKYMTNSKQRYDKHFKQPRHVNFYRDRAYKGNTNCSLRVPGLNFVRKQRFLQFLINKLIFCKIKLLFRMKSWDNKVGLILCYDISFCIF